MGNGGTHQKPSARVPAQMGGWAGRDAGDGRSWAPRGSAGVRRPRRVTEGWGVLTTRDSEGAVWDGDLLGHDGLREGMRTWVSGGKR